MFVQIQNTPNPNSLKFLPGKKVSEVGPIEILDINKSNNELVKNILSIHGVRGIFLYEDFLSVNKKSDTDWSDIKHVVISYINDFYDKGNVSVINKSLNKKASDNNLGEIEKKIIHVLETKVRPAVSKDGGDIIFKDFKDGKVTVKLQGSCSGCPSSTLTLKRGVENLLNHYVPEVKEVISI
tara:strand:- start:6 stop:551 length:546 start_codon:yes stop_codon:yes gene_type:complete